MKTFKSYGITAIDNTGICLLKIRMNADTYNEFALRTTDISTISKDVQIYDTHTKTGLQRRVATVTILATHSECELLLAASKVASNTMKIQKLQDQLREDEFVLERLEQQKHENYVRSLKQAGPTLKRTIKSKETPLERTGRLLSSFSSIFKY